MFTDPSLLQLSVDEIKEVVSFKNVSLEVITR